MHNLDAQTALFEFSEPWQYLDLLLFYPHRDQYSDETAGGVLGPCLTTPPCGHIGKVYLLLAEIQ